MPIEPDTEIFRLRRALRDLVSMSTMPAAWAARKPSEIAAGLGDVLIGSLQLDFAFVRLSDPTRSTAVEVARGHAWKAFPEWLQQNRGGFRWLTRWEVIPDVGGSAEPCRGLVVPIGVEAEAGVVAAACGRADFPGEIDLLLLSVAANHAATAFQSALAEQELRQVRSVLETKVSERTSELRRATADLQTILDASPVGVALFDKDRAVQRCNRAFERILGWRADEIAGRPASVLKIKDCQPSPLAGRLDGGEAFANVETRLARKDGTEFDAAVSCAFLQDESGSRAGFVGTIQDISDYKRTDEALRRSEAYLAEAQRLTHTGSWAYSTRTGEPTHSSEEHSRLFGFGPEMGRPSAEDFRQRIHPEDRAGASEIRDRAIREKTGTDHTLRALLPDGTIRHIHTVSHPVFGASGELVEMIGTSMDVTERKQLDDERERLLAGERAALADAVAAQQRFRDLVNSVEGIVWEAEVPSFQFLFVSKQAERILGYPVERWLSEPTFWADHLHRGDREWTVRFREQAVAEKRDHDFEYRMVAADGRPVWVRDLATVVVQKDRPTRLRGVIVDITERKRAEEDRRAHLSFFESMDRINRAIQGTNDLEQMMSSVLDEVLSIFHCDRAWLIYPCDPEATSYGVPMEQTRPEFPGAFSLGHDVPMDPGTAEMFEAMRASSGPLQFGPGSEHRMPEEVAKRFSVKSQISMVVYPKGDKPYLFGLHQCSDARGWTPQEERLFQEVGRRLADALTSLSMFRNLRESEARLEEAQRIAHLGYWERDVETNRVTWSDETYRIFGLAPEEGAIDFAGFQQLIHPGDRQSMLAATAEAVRGGLRYDVEYRVARRTGEVRIVHSQGDVTRDESGRPQRVFGIIQDVTDRKRAEAEVRESERRYRYVFQSTGVSIWEEDFSQIKDAIDELKARGVRDFREYFAAHPEFVERAIAMVKVVDVNDATLELFGAESKDELLGSLRKVFLLETVEVFLGELIAIAEGQTSFEAETVLQTLKGERLTVLFTITLPPPPARFDNVLVTLMDITKRKRAEYLTAQVFESSPDRVSIIGTDYRYRRVNPVFERNWNIPAEKVIGMHIADLLGVEVFEQKVKPYLDRCFAGEDVSYVEWFSDPLGRRYLALTYSPLRPDSDRVEAALVIVRDLTDLILASEALRQAHADLAHISRVTTMGELTASLAHEINQPIAAAITNANACVRWLARAQPDIEEAREAALRIVKDGTRAADIISRIRLLFRKGAPHRESVDVNEVIQEMIVLLRGEAARYLIPIRAELAADLPKVNGDRVQLQQVFMNLMLNGIDAIKDRSAAGELTIRSERVASDQLLISVSDTGVGLPPEHTAQIFDAFFSTKRDGTGMGLPISRSIIESHGGRLWAAANSERGATFHFTLPSEVEGGQ
jgi:PAS domain S-box-containing protein